MFISFNITSELLHKFYTIFLQMPYNYLIVNSLRIKITDIPINNKQIRDLQSKNINVKVSHQFKNGTMT